MKSYLLKSLQCCYWLWWYGYCFACCRILSSNIINFELFISFDLENVCHLSPAICHLTQWLHWSSIYSKFLCDLPLDWIGGYGGGGLIQVPSGRLICRRSDENSAKYCSAGITLKNLFIFHRNHQSHFQMYKRKKEKYIWMIKIPLLFSWKDSIRFQWQIVFFLSFYEKYSM